VNDEIADMPGTILFPTAETQKQMEQLLDTALHETQAQMRHGRVAPDFDSRKFAEELSHFDFAAPVPLDDLLHWVVDTMRDGNVQMTHPRYFGLFNPSPAIPSLLAERIVASFNPQLASAKTSPAAVAMEAHVIAQIAHRIGFTVSRAGHFTNSGSEANFTALICALTNASPTFRENGARAFRVPPAIYISKDAHLAWLKIAHQAGIGRLAVRMISTDGHGRMSGEALRTAVERDIDNGVIPVMVVATAGTTVAGMVDPLVESADIADRAGAWFHVDAAWGGAAIASSSVRSALAGIELADSVTIDAHKWLATTMACGMFITAKPTILSEAFGVTASFMPSGVHVQDPYADSILWSRRFLGLRLFMNLAASGWLGYAQHVDHTMMLVNHLRTRLEAAGWKIANPDSLGVLCVTPPAGFKPVHTIVDEIVTSGQAWVSVASFEETEVVRICITNGRTEIHDIDALARMLNFYGEVASERKMVTN
jgi:glutamate/tyrosine decarboxylase-like PLP-dependent enzyme